jgi:carbon storage regulator
MIGDDIEITVAQVRGEKVRIGITAPRTIAIHRKEVWESIKKAAGESRKSPTQEPTQ